MTDPDPITEAADKFLEQAVAPPLKVGPYAGRKPHTAALYDRDGNLLYHCPIQNLNYTSAYDGPIDVRLVIRIDRTEET